MTEKIPMKKSILLVAVLMALVSLCLVLASCDSDSSDPTPPPEPAPTTVAVESVSLDKATMVLKTRTDGTLTATVLPENATDKSVTWSSDKPEVATVDQTGKITGVAEGTATIVVITADGVRTAVCVVTVADEVYTVKFDVQGYGTAPENQYAAKDGKIFEPTDPTADGVNFKGWYKEAACTNRWKFNADTVTADNTILYAKWTAIEYSITYMDETVEFPAVLHEKEYPTKHTYGTATTLKSASVPGYTFEGWYEEETYSTKVESLGATEYTGNITLYAKLTPIEDHLSGEFSVSADKKVYFSKGNLQATIDASGAPTAWKFAEKQYDYIGGNVANTSIGNSTTSGTAGDVDLFGWSTDATSNNWGIHTKKEATQNYTTGAFKDWEKAIGNGNTWHTLSKDEWVYLFNTRTSSTIGGTENARFAKVKVAGKAGILLFPDVFEWTGDMGTAPANCNTTNTDWTAVTDYTTALFEEMEKASNRIAVEEYFALISAFKIIKHYFSSLLRKERS